MYTLIWFHRLLDGWSRLWRTHWSTWPHSSRSCSWLPSYTAQIRFDFRRGLLRLWFRTSHFIDLLQRQIISRDCTNMSDRTIILIWKVLVVKLGRFLRLRNKLHWIILSCISHVFGRSLHFKSVFANVILASWSLVSAEHLVVSGVLRDTSASWSILIFKESVARIVSA